MVSDMVLPGGATRRMSNEDGGARRLGRVCGAPGLWVHPGNLDQSSRPVLTKSVTLNSTVVNATDRFLVADLAQRSKLRSRQASYLHISMQTDHDPTSQGPDMAAATA